MKNFFRVSDETYRHCMVHAYNTAQFKLYTHIYDRCAVQLMANFIYVGGVLVFSLQGISQSALIARES